MENITNVVIFYACSGTFTLTLTALILFFFRQRFGIREMVWRHLMVSVRQGFWVAAMLIIALILQSYNLFSWLNSIFLVFALTFLEIYFLYNERRTQANNLNIT